MKPIVETVYENKTVRFVLTTSARGMEPGIVSMLEQHERADASTWRGSSWYRVIATQSKGKVTAKGLATLHKIARAECEHIVADQLSRLIREQGAR